jgi:NarL family two-component system response regulator LiaR
VGKSAATDELIEAFHAVLAGEARLPKRLLAPVLRALQEAPRFNEWQERVNVLTPREQEILALLVAGRDRASIAEELVVSINTVRTHTKNILAKLDVHSSIEAVSIALRAGMRPAKARATAGR